MAKAALSTGALLTQTACSHLIERDLMCWMLLFHATCSDAKGKVLQYMTPVDNVCELTLCAEV